MCLVQSNSVPVSAGPDAAKDAEKPRGASQAPAVPSVRETINFHSPDALREGTSFPEAVVYGLDIGDRP
jgi:hypothetical protein